MKIVRLIALCAVLLFSLSACGSMPSTGTWHSNMFP